jgi:hypothetical protein
VGLSSVKRYVAAYREGRSLTPKKLPGSKAILDKVASKLLEADLPKRPAATLPQKREFLRRVCAVEVGDSTVSRVLKRLGWTRKKIANIATMVLATSRLAARFVELLGVACSTLLAGAERQRLQVSTNQLPVPDVLFPERSLQRVLFSKNVPVDDPCHDWK